MVALDKIEVTKDQVVDAVTSVLTEKFEIAAVDGLVLPPQEAADLGVSIFLLLSGVQSGQQDRETAERG
ncbi:MAG: hypothetical protein ACR2IV_10220 [Bryobacteraceae bacterium]